MARAKARCVLLGPLDRAFCPDRGDRQHKASFIGGLGIKGGVHARGGRDSAPKIRAIPDEEIENKSSSAAFDHDKT